MRKSFALFCLLLSLLLIDTHNVQAQESRYRIEFTSQDGSTLESLARGEPGSGIAFIFHTAHSPDQPRLLIVFQNDENGAQARLFDNAQQELTWDNGEVNLEGTTAPTILMIAPDGWWVRDGVTNYNLTIAVRGRVHAMWGAVLGEATERGGWLSEVTAGSSRPMVRIQTGDPDNTGVPQWDLRRLLPWFPGKGYYRTNYAERQCDSPSTQQPTVLSAWPFIATDAVGARFEQPNGLSVPPIVVDWERGVVTYFSELVTTRNQSCSYAIYSINALQEDVVNQQNFETPFAFYDFAGAGNGYPNAIIRTEYFWPRDVWSFGLKVEGQEIRAVPDAFQRIRYSWRTAAGDGTWDYKIEVMGTDEYEQQIEIAGGLYTVAAPSHERFPTWVAEREWPVTSFVSIENRPYFSQEGIYEYAPTLAGVGYLYGWSDVPPDAFQNIVTGQRGEYRYQTAEENLLYVSPIDGRLHLRSAEGGVWRLDERTTLKLHKLDDSPYLKGWEVTRDGERREALYHLPGFLLYTNGDTVSLDAVDMPVASHDNISLPTDLMSWNTVRTIEQTLVEAERSPFDLKSWVEPFSAENQTILENAQIRDVRITDSGFRFRLLTNGTANLTRNDLNLPTPAVGAADVIIEYDGAEFRAVPVERPELALGLELSGESAVHRPIMTQLRLHNRGVADVSGAQWQIVAEHPKERIVLVDEVLTLFSAETRQQIATWTPNHTGDWTIYAELRQDNDVLFSQAHTTTVTQTQSESTDLPVSDSTFLSSLIVIFTLAAVAIVTGQALHDRSL